MFERIQIVLIHTSHPGNIGASARAMKTMGFKHLTLVSPKYFPDPQATALASTASDILDQALCVNRLDEALADRTYIIGSSARTRHLSAPQLSVRACAEHLAEKAAGENIAILFGEERTGLSNEALDRCHAYLQIPSSAEYSSLNLSQAVQIVCYELRQALSTHESKVESSVKPYANDQEVEAYLQHLERLMIRTEFLDPKFPKRLMSRLHRLYLRARPEKQEINILRGILTAIEKNLGPTAHE